MKNHPNQPLVLDKHEVIRFRQNKIVAKMLEFCTERGCGLNEISCDDITTEEDYRQLMQLIGYSVSGYGDLHICTDKEWRRLEKQVERLNITSM